MTLSRLDESNADIFPQKKHKKSGWDKRIYLLLTGLVLASAVKLVFDLAIQGPLPPSDYPDIGGNFTLNNIDGPVSLDDFSGKVVVIFFGYANCPDICPTALSNVAAAFRKLKEMGDSHHVQGLFITLDPERDSVTHMDSFVKFFHPNIVGLSGDRRQIDDTATRYRVGHHKETSSSTLGYSIAHTGYLYIIRPDGSVGELLSHNSTPKNIAKAVMRWLPWATDK